MIPKKGTSLLHLVNVLNDERRTTMLIKILLIIGLLSTGLIARSATRSPEEIHTYVLVSKDGKTWKLLNEEADLEGARYYRLVKMEGKP